MRASSILRVLAMSLVAVGSEAMAQERTGSDPTDSLAVGMRVRVQTNAGVRFEGSVGAIDTRSLTLVDGRGMGVALQREQVAGLEVSTPRPRGRGAVRGAVIGSAIGAVSGVTAYLVDREAKRSDGLCESLGTYAECTKASDIPLAALGGALFGAGVGAIWPGHQWQPVLPNGLSLGLGPGRRGGFTVQAKLSF